jgi:hypothetical protein
LKSTQTCSRDESFEDQVREADPQAYIELETALDQVKDAVMAQPIDPAKVKTAYVHLKDEAHEIAGRLEAATGPSAQLRALGAYAKEGIAAAEQNKPELMRATYDEIHTQWESFEDQVREKDATGYVELESALDKIKDAVNAQPIDAATVKAAYEQLEHEADEVAGRLGTAGAAAARSKLRRCFRWCGLCSLRHALTSTTRD